MISIGEALSRMMPRFVALAPERVPLDRSLGRFLAAPLRAREDVPGFDNAAMDGYAVLASDLAGDAVALTVRGESRAGGGATPPLSRGTAMRIFTGAPMPEGADAVVMQEDVERDGERAVLRGPVRPGSHVRRRGEVVREGDVLLEAGAAIGVGEVGLCASQGHAELRVHRRPRVALLSSGDELRELGEPARFGSLVDSNAHALAAAVREAGGEPLVLPRAPDDRAALSRAVRDAIAGADVLVTCGGVSVGKHDLVHEAFSEVGLEDVFWKVRVKPGKPLRFAMAGSVPVVGLPGNPVSAVLTFELFVRPGLRRMLGDPAPFRRTLEVELSSSLRAPDTRTELARAALLEREGAPPLATPHRDQGSAALTSLVALDALVVLEQGAGELPAGSHARALDLRGGRGSARPPF